MRTVLLIVGTIVLGAASSVGVVALGAFAPRAIDSRTFTVEGWRVTTMNTRGFASVSASIDRAEQHTAAKALDDPRLPWWHGAIRRPVLAADHDGYMHNATAFGWPFAGTSVEYRIFRHADGTISTEDVQTRWFLSGVLANIALFSAAWYALFCLPRAARQARRRLRGLCAACGYDLRAATTSVCSECGSDREVLRRRAKRSAWAHGVAAALVAVVVAIPLARTWQSAADDRARFAGGGWFDEVLSGHRSMLDDDYDAFHARVTAIPDHEKIIASRLSGLSDEEFEKVSGFVVDMAMIEPRAEYLPLIDKVVARAREQGVWWPVMAYGGYPWSAIDGRLEALLEEALADARLGAGIVNVTRMSWESHPESPAQRAAAEGVLRQMLNGGPTARVELLAAMWLFKLGWMEAEEAERQVERILERDGSLIDDPLLAERWWEEGG